MNALDALDFTEATAMALRRLSGLIEFARSQEGIFRSQPLWNETDVTALKTGSANNDSVRGQDGFGLFRLKIYLEPRKLPLCGELVRETRHESGVGWERHLWCPFCTVGGNQWHVHASARDLLESEGERSHLPLLFTTDGTVQMADLERDSRNVRAIFRHLDFATQEN